MTYQLLVVSPLRQLTVSALPLGATDAAFATKNAAQACQAGGLTGLLPIAAVRFYAVAQPEPLPDFEAAALEQSLAPAPLESLATPHQLPHLLPLHATREPDDLPQQSHPAKPY